MRRGRTIAKVVAIHFAPTALRQLRTIRQGALPAAQLARPLRKSFQDLGGTFMKFGQIIASSPGMFGDDVADEFRACLDTGPPVPFPDVRQRVEEDLGLPLRDAFAEFEPDRSGRPPSPSCTGPACSTGGRWRSRCCGPRSSTSSRPTST